MKEFLKKLINGTEKQPTMYIRASRLIAAGSYTRGLWSPFIMWRKFASPPFSGRCPQWGVDEEFVRHHYLLAFYYALVFSVFEICLIFSYYFFDKNQIAGILFIFIVILQWFLFPWIKSCSILSSRNMQNVISKCHVVTKEIITDENNATIGDLGYLIREAIFSVDANKKSDFELNQAKDIGSIKLNDFFSSIEDDIKQLKNCETTICKINIKSHLDIQPKGFAWNRLSSTIDYSNDQQDNLGKILIFAQDNENDGLATAEIGIKRIAPHFSFHLRLRWMPPIKSRYQKLLLLSRQHTWWQFFISLFFITTVVFLNHFLSSYLVDSEDISNINYYPNIMVNRIDLLVVLGTVMLFSPIVLFFSVLFKRTLRYVRAIICVAAGITFKIESPESFLFAAAEGDIKENESLYNGIFYMRLFEEVILNKIIFVLKEHNIDTDSIKQEFKNFQNDGIYVTGGSIQAENIAVGRFSSIRNKRKRKSSRKGSAPLLNR